MEKAQICICVPYFGGKDWEHDQLIDQAEAAGYMVERLHNYPYIDQARCLLAERALRRGAEVVFFIDHDMIFDVEDILSMSAEAHAREAVVSGLYLTRKIGGTAVVRLNPVPESILCFKAGDLYPCSLLPGGFTAIPRAVFEKVPVRKARLGDGKTIVRLWFYNEVMESSEGTEDEPLNLWGGEDMAFSKRCREAGVPLFVDTRPRVFHKGTHKFALEDGYLSHDVKTKEVLEIRVREISVGK